MVIRRLLNRFSQEKNVKFEKVLISLNNLLNCNTIYNYSHEQCWMKVYQAEKPPFKFPYC